MEKKSWVCSRRCENIVKIYVKEIRDYSAALTDIHAKENPILENKIKKWIT